MSIVHKKNMVYIHKKHGPSFGTCEYDGIFIY